MIIGITGGIGAGKSTVGKVLKGFGVKVLEADLIAKMYMDQERIQKRIFRSFGKGVLDSRKKIDREKLSQVVFRDAQKLKTLEDILHPPVICEIEKQISKARKRKRGNQHLAIIVPLLFEKKLECLFDLTVCVTSPKKLSIARSAKRLCISPRAVLQRMRRQMSSSRKKLLADEEIRNDGDKRKLEKTIKNFLEKIKEDNLYGSTQ